MRSLFLSFFLSLLIIGSSHAAPLRIAAASDLKFAMAVLVADYQRTHPTPSLEVIYGSSGKFLAQIQQGAPYDLYFSADIAYPQKLHAAGMTGSKVMPYAVGNLVLWSATRDASALSLRDLLNPSFKRIAIANPRHAPYGQRAESALRTTGIWDQIESRLVYGENIAQAAQFVQTGNADIGIIALSLAMSPELSKLGAYAPVPEALHEPLLQGFVITRRAADNPAARRFAEYMTSPAARKILSDYGFRPPPGQE